MKRRFLPLMAMFLVVLMIGSVLAGCAKDPSDNSGDDNPSDNLSDNPSDNDNNTNTTDPDNAPVESVKPSEPEVKGPYDTFRINCGGEKWEDPNTGNIWEKNTEVDYVKGGHGLINGTRTSGLAQTCEDSPYPQLHYDNMYGNPLEYKFDDIMPGIYNIKLYTGETHYDDGASGARVFDIVLNNVYVVDKARSPSKELGKWHALVLEYVFEVKEGESLSIKLSPTTDNGLLSGIEITPAEEGAELTEPIETLIIEDPDMMSVIRLNCGGNDYTDGEGKLWLSDNVQHLEGGWGYTIQQGKSGSMNGVTAADVENATIDHELYRTTRWGKPLKYQFDNLVPGDYIFNFYMVEDYHSEANKRTFDIWVYELNNEEDTIVKVNKDLNDVVDLVKLGGKFKPYEILGFEFTVREGEPIVVEFEELIDNGIVAALEIIKK